MRILKNTLASAALVGLLAAQPALAAPAPARTSAAVTDSENMRGAPAIAVIGAFVVLLVLFELIGVIDVFGDDDAKSP